jgi:hypothetical protein
LLLLLLLLLLLFQLFDWMFVCTAMHALRRFA